MKRVEGQPFGSDEDGVILAEALIVVPFVTLFAVGILEFGNVLWQRHALELGVRDAARYWSRCRPVSDGSAYMPCSTTTATNIALFGVPNPGSDDNLRVPNWYGAGAVTLEPANPPTTPAADDVVRVTGTTTYSPSPLFFFLDIVNIEISYTHEQRYQGW